MNFIKFFNKNIIYFITNVFHSKLLNFKLSYSKSTQIKYAFSISTWGFEINCDIKSFSFYIYIWFLFNSLIFHIFHLLKEKKKNKNINNKKFTSKVSLLVNFYCFITLKLTSTINI